MKKVSIAFLVAMAVASFGCSKKGGGGGSNTLAKQEEFKNQMCACKDKACIDKVTGEMTRWSQEAAKSGEAQKLSDEDMKRSTAIGTEMTNCMTKILTDNAGAGAGGAPPAGGTEGSAAAPPPAAGSAEGSAAAAPPAAGSAEGSAAAAPPAAGSAEGSAAAGSAK